MARFICRWWWFGADGFEAAGQDLSASGSNRDSAAKARPYIFILENTTTTDVSNVTFLDAANNTRTAGISYTYGLTNLTYNQVISNIAGNGLVFGVGLTRLVGYNATIPLIPLYDNYQQIKNQVDLQGEYFVNGMTAIKVAKVYASTKLTIYLFPFAKTNEFKQLKGGATSRYKNPGVNPYLRK